MPQPCPAVDVMRRVVAVLVDQGIDWSNLERTFRTIMTTTGCLIRSSSSTRSLNIICQLHHHILFCYSATLLTTFCHQMPSSTSDFIFFIQSMCSSYLANLENFNLHLLPLNSQKASLLWFFSSCSRYSSHFENTSFFACQNNPLLLFSWPFICHQTTSRTSIQLI